MKMEVRWAQKTGNVHAAEGCDCQDYAEGFYDPGRDLAVAALADGAGSYQHSAAGAKAAVAAVLEYFGSHERIENRKDFVQSVSRAVEQVDPVNMDVGTTLLFVAATSNGFVAGHIGDGVILKREKGAFSVLSYPENGEHLWETYLLPCDDRSDRFRFYEGQGIAGFLLASDGVAPQLYEENGQGCAACEKLYRWCEQLSKEEFALRVREHFAGVFAKFSADDKSLAMIWTEAEPQISD